MIFNDKVKAEIENCINSRDRKKKDLRAQFLMTGFVYDPNNSYRIEFRFKDHRTANKVIKELRDFKLIAKISVIDKRELYVVYVSMPPLYAAIKKGKPNDKEYLYDEKALNDYTGL